ncbi:MAG: hypothetical protein LBF97_00725, partial [Elusimicrobiota bacterium]|nr:hypothetical protein [Elusimicrobiota bacterium]
MATDLMSIPTKEQLIKDVVLDYAPFYSVFKPVPQEAKIENLKFTIIQGDNDIEAKIINEEDTERQTIKAGEKNKIYKKIFKGAKYKESQYQANSGLPELNARVIKAFHKQLDKEIFNGIDNNGVIVSSDPNFILNT